MDESETRLAALETLLMELLARTDPALLKHLKEGIEAGIPQPGEPGYQGEEHTIRLQARQIIRDAELRFDLFSIPANER